MSLRKQESLRIWFCRYKTACRLLFSSAAKGKMLPQSTRLQLKTEPRARTHIRTHAHHNSKADWAYSRALSGDAARRHTYPCFWLHNMLPQSVTPPPPPPPTDPTPPHLPQATQRRRFRCVFPKKDVRLTYRVADIHKAPWPWTGLQWRKVKSVLGYCFAEGLTDEDSF